MSTQTENAVLNVKINGQQAISTFTELNKLRNEQIDLVKKLDKNSPNYNEQKTKLQELNAQYAAWKKELNGVAKAQEGVKPIDSLLGTLKDQAGGNDSISKILSIFSTGYATIAKTGEQALAVLMAITGASKKQQAALKEVWEEQEALRLSLAANATEQQALAAALAAATTAEEANTIATAQNKLVEQENAIATKIQAAAQVEATLAAEGSTIALKALKIALASTGIGLLIIAIAGLVAYFEQTNEGAKKIKVIFAQVDALFQQFMKTIAPIGKALYDTFAESRGPLELFGALLRQAVLPLATLVTLISDIKNGNFKQAFIDAGKAFNQWGNNIRDTLHGAYVTTKDLSQNLATATKGIDLTGASFKNAAMQAKEVTVARQNLTKEERLWSEEKIKQQGEVELLTKKLKDGYLTESERLKLGDKAKALRESIFNKDLEYAKKNAELVQKEQDLNSKKDYQAITDAKNRVQEVINAKELEVQGITNKQSKLDAKQQAQQLKAQRDLEAFGKRFESVQSQYLAVADKAADGSLDSLDSQIKVINDKFQKLIQNLSKAAKDKNASKAASDQLNQEIEDIRKKGGLIDQEIAKVKKAQFEKQQKYNEAQRKQAEDFNKSIETLINQGFDKQKAELGNQQDNDLNGVTDVDPEAAEKHRLDIKAEYAQKEYELEQTRLTALKQLYQSEAKDTATIDKKMADNTIKENERASKKKLDDDKKYKEAKKQLEAMALDVVEQGAEALQQVLGKNTIAYKAAFAVEKAVAAARVIMKTEESIAAFSAANAGIPVIGAGLVIAYKIAAHITEGLSLAAIAKQTIDGVSGNSKYAQGGILPDGPSHATGGLKLIDPYGMVYGEVEGGEPILSKNTYANNKGLVDALLNSKGKQLNLNRINEATTSRERRISNLTVATATKRASVPSSSDKTDNTLHARFDELIKEQQLTRTAFKNMKLIFSNRIFNKETDKTAKIIEDANA